MGTGTIFPGSSVNDALTLLRDETMINRKKESRKTNL